MGGTFADGGRVEVHEMSMDGGVMKMRALPGGLEIKPGATVELKPGSFHMMLHDLRRQLAKGDKVAGTLMFEKAGSVAIEYQVEALGASAPGGGSSEPAGHMH
jgi:copper(I)-binding protein